MSIRIIDGDFVVIGSGIAGLLSALHLAQYGRVVVITKKERADSNTNFAQGGIACVIDSADSFEQHVQDTLEAGAGLCHEDVVRTIVGAAPARIAELEQLGVSFSEGNDARGYDLGREGGHSRRRVLHAGDITGREVEQVLLKRVLNEPAITLFEHTMAIDLITTGWLGSGGENRCVGLYVLDRQANDIFAVRAPYTVCASGGGGKVYLYTSNPDIATADGVAMAWRAGVPIVNMEFIQFHPTCLYHPQAKSFLISEAVRGEGARLVDSDGRPFMERYDTRADLAPRDIVARAIDREMKTRGVPCVYLDIRQHSETFLRRRFPNIYDTCRRYGIDMATDLVPVVPAAHYFCGGVAAGIDGMTALPGLLAVGETAFTGLHGANRLASNSLLEALVCAHVMAENLGPHAAARRDDRPAIPDWELGAAVPSDEAVVVEHNWNEVRTCMWDYVGIVRSNRRLARAARRIRNLRREIREYYLNYLVTADVLELRNIAAAAELIIRCAQQRHESRGLHYTLDYPEPSEDERPMDVVIADPVGSMPENGGLDCNLAASFAEPMCIV